MPESGCLFVEADEVSGDADLDVDVEVLGRGREVDDGEPGGDARSLPMRLTKTPL